MSYRVICISRAMAAGGEEVGRLVAEGLGYRYVDQEIVTQAAERAGISASSMADIEHTPSALWRIIESLDIVSLSAMTPVMIPASDGVSFLAKQTPAYQALIQRVIRQTAEAGNVVIVAHAASIPLAGMPGLLRVLVTASPEIRAERLRAEHEVDARQAKKMIAESDKQRRAYLKRFYEIRQELPTLFDLVINTDVLTPRAAADVLLSLAKGEG